jgi:hypothetical protein
LGTKTSLPAEISNASCAGAACCGIRPETPPEQPFRDSEEASSSSSSSSFATALQNDAGYESHN